jgi:DNA-binding beta-propeller fold protein YncE
MIHRSARHIGATCAAALAAAAFVAGCSTYSATTPGAPGLPARSSQAVVRGIASSALLVTLPSTDQLAFVDPATLTIRALLPLPANPTDVVMHPTHSIAFVAVTNGIQLVDTARQKLLPLISVPGGFIRFAVAPDGDVIYAVNSIGVVSVISVVHRAVLQTFNVGANAGGIAYSSTYGEIYVSTPDTNAVAVFDAKTFAPDKPFYGGRCPKGRSIDPCDPADLTVSPDGKYLLATDERGIMLALDANVGDIDGKVTLSSRSGRSERFLSLDPANGDFAISDIGCCRQEILQVGSVPPFPGPTLLTGANVRTRIIGVAFDPSGNAWSVADAYPPRVGRVVKLPFKQGDRELALGTQPGDIAYAP